MMAGEQGTRREDQAEQPRDQAEQKTGSTGVWSYFLVRNAIFSVTVAFIFVMGLFAFLEVFNSQNAANVGLGLTRLHGLIRVKRSGSTKGVEDGQDRQALLA